MLCINSPADRLQASMCYEFPNYESNFPPSSCWGLTARSRVPRQTPERSQNSCSSGPWQCRWCTLHLHISLQICKNTKTSQSYGRDTHCQARFLSTCTDIFLHICTVLRRKHGIKITSSLKTRSGGEGWDICHQKVSVLLPQNRCEL